MEKSMFGNSALFRRESERHLAKAAEYLSMVNGDDAVSLLNRKRADAHDEDARWLLKRAEEEEALAA